MSFRKRNVVVSSSSAPSSLSPDGTPAASGTSTAENVRHPSALEHKIIPSIPGVRPSPVFGNPTTSTGTPTLDALLGGHAGFPLGTSLFIEENSTTDFAGALLRYYAAEGIVQGHKVIIVGAGENWTRELPGLTGVADVEDGETKSSRKEAERMKIAWRYESLGKFGSGIGGSRGQGHVASPSAGTTIDDSSPPVNTPSRPFCHTYDLTKRLNIPSSNPPILLPSPPALSGPHTSPFAGLLQSLARLLSESSSSTIYRLVIPNLLSPAMYPINTSQPQYILQFLHSLRALLRKHCTQLTTMISFPLALYPRTSGLVRWMEILMDGVIELTPVPSLADAETRAGRKGGDEAPQGLVRVWKSLDGGKGRMGMNSEMGMEGGDDLAFTLTRRRFAIAAYSLPPADGNDDGGGRGNVEGSEEAKKKTKVDIEF